MDGHHFDNFTRAFAEPGIDRRRVLRAGLGGLVAAALGALRIDPAGAAKCRGDGEICRKNGDCCAGTCGPKDRRGRQYCGCPPNTTSCGNTCCTAGQTCLDGACCPAANVCEGACCATGTGCLEGQCCPNDRICGDNCCSAGETCIDGACCPADQTCDGLCCADSENCVNGACCASACGDECCGPTETCRTHGNLQFCCTDPDYSYVVVVCPDGSQDGTVPGCVGFCCISNQEACPVCVNGVCSGICCDEGLQCCNGVCCQSGEVCQNNVCTGCEPEKLCLSNTECCAAEESCLAMGCCPTERVCGASCCVGEEVCFIESGVCGLPVE